MAGNQWGNVPPPSPNAPTSYMPPPPYMPRPYMPPPYMPPPYPPAPPQRRGLPCAVIGLWVLAAIAAILFLICLIVFLAARPSELDQLACGLGNAASCQRWRAIGSLRAFSAVSCILLAIVGGISGIIALVATLNRR